MGGGEFYDIGADLLADAEAQMEFKLVVPETARRGKRNPGTAFWSEAGVVVSASQDAKDEKDGSRTQILSFETKISHEGSGKNIGKPLTTYMRINHQALKKAAPQNWVTMSNMALAKLKELFRSIGVEGDLDGGGFSQTLLAEYFPRTTEFPGGESPLVGRVIYFEVKQGKRKFDDGSEKEQAEISKILMPAE